jgi:hypothetical protein
MTSNSLQETMEFTRGIIVFFFYSLGVHVGKYFLRFLVIYFELYDLLRLRT